MTLTRRTLLAAGAASGLGLLGCGGKGRKGVGTARKALQRRSVAIDYASYYGPVADVRRLATAHAQQAGAQVTFSDDADGTAAQVANLKLWTGEQGGFLAVAVAPFDVAAVDPVAEAAIARGVAVVAFVTELGHQSAAITVDHGRAGTLLAQDAVGAGAGDVVLVRPAQGLAIPDPFVPGFAPAEEAIRRSCPAPGCGSPRSCRRRRGRTRASVVAAALRANPRVRTVLAWSDGAALGAAEALEGVDGGYAGGLGAPGATSRAALDALTGRTPLRCLVLPRLSDLAAALVDVPLALARGEETDGRRVPVQRLTPRTKALVRAYAADFSG